MRIPKLLNDTAAHQRGKDAVMHFELAIAMQPQVRARIKSYLECRGNAGYVKNMYLPKAGLWEHVQS